jgi:hypothetical protein
VRVRDVLSHPVGGRLIAAQAVSEVGDYLGLAALLLLAYQSTGSALASAAVFGVRSVPAVLVATIFSGWLDRPARRSGLTALSVAGAPIIAIPVLQPRAWAALLAAGLLGAVRAAYQGISVALVAETVPPAVRLRVFGIANLINQLAQIVGLLTGAAITAHIAARPVLLADAASFLLAAAILTRLPRTKHHVRRRTPPGAGMRVIVSHPTLRIVALLVWASVIGWGFPEAVAPRIAQRAWLPLLIAAASIGGALFSLLATRGDWLGRPANQVRVVAAGGLGALAVAVVLTTHGPQWALFATTVAVGAASGWIIGAQSTFARLTPPDRMSQVETAMVATNILISGLGVIALGALTTWTGPADAYTVVGALGLVAAATAMRYSTAPRSSYNRGGRTILEDWIPAEDLADLNENIVGKIEVSAEYL